ncbi:hypothetical protein Hamer_G024130 [Homarus americanus]|uniref:Uncharacterized protein n=1 Tax=Homarus americanus TaxID=6706 RepID=A0A8J5MNL3_HOMAM|nr:hypothetical protein Hamer_G024130 [Homarus americanus]
MIFGARQRGDLLRQLTSSDPSSQSGSSSQRQDLGMHIPMSHRHMGMSRSLHVIGTACVQERDKTTRTALTDSQRLLQSHQQHTTPYPPNERSDFSLRRSDPTLSRSDPPLRRSDSSLSRSNSPLRRPDPPTSITLPHRNL